MFFNPTASGFGHKGTVLAKILRVLYEKVSIFQAKKPLDYLTFFYAGNATYHNNYRKDRQSHIS